MGHCPWCGQTLRTYRLGSVERCAACRQPVASGEDGSERQGQLAEPARCPACGVLIEEARSKLVEPRAPWL